MARTPSRYRRAHCPSCHQTICPTPILWGMPSQEGFDAAARGEFVLGGCLVGELDPSHVCPNCDARLFEMPDGAFHLWTPFSAFPMPWNDGPLVN